MCFFTASRLHRYCEPLRHPTRPGLSLASCQLIHTAITAGTSRVAHGPHCVHAVANTPAGRMELVPSYNSIRFGLPTKPGRVGSCITIFGACLAFTSRYGLHARRVALATLCTRGFSSLVASTAAVFPRLWTSAFTAHPVCPSSVPNCSPWTRRQAPLTQPVRHKW
jgi:hypothetical protein